MPTKASRLTSVVAASAAAMLALSACGGDSDPDPTSDASSNASSSASSSSGAPTLAEPDPKDAKKVEAIEVTAGKGKKAPSIKIEDAPLSVGETTLDVKKEGSGKALASDAYVEVDLAMFSGKDGKAIEGSETYTTKPILLQPGMEGGLPGLSKALSGQKVGAHGVAVMPPKDLFGEQGAPQYGIDGKDNLVLVYDVRSVMPETAEGKTVKPKEGLPEVKFHDDAPADITIPKDAPKPKKLVTQKLIEGEGETIKEGDQVMASYTGVHFKDGKVFDTSFKEGGGPYPFVIGQPGVIPAWQKAAEGAKVGDRLLVVVPSKEGYGKEGSPDGSIKPNEDLVFVMDILGAY